MDNIEEVMPKIENLFNNDNFKQFFEVFKEAFGELKGQDNNNDLFNFDQIGNVFKDFLPKQGEVGLVFINHLKDLYKQGKTFNIYYKDDDKEAVGYYDKDRAFPEGKYFVMDGNAYNINETHFFFTKLKMFKDGKWIQHLLEKVSPQYLLEVTDYLIKEEMPPQVFNDFKKCLEISGAINFLNIMEDFEGKEKLIENFKYFLESEAAIYHE